MKLKLLALPLLLSAQSAFAALGPYEQRVAEIVKIAADQGVKEAFKSNTSSPIQRIEYRTKDTYEVSNQDCTMTVNIVTVSQDRKTIGPRKFKVVIDPNSACK